MNRQQKIEILKQAQSGQVPFKQLLASLQPLEVDRLTVDEKYLLLNIERDIKEGQQSATAPGVLMCKEHYRKVSNQRTGTLPEPDAVYPTVKEFYTRLGITNRWPKLYQQ